jgi:hypothetical protein
MRLIGLIFAALLVASAPVAAQGWQEYDYPDFAFSIAFPGAPKVESVAYRTSDGREAQARVYTLARESSVLTMTVATLPKMTETAVLDHAVRTLAQGGEVKLDIPHRIRQVYGRQLSIIGPDGSQSIAAVFYHKQRLYQIEGRTLATANSATGDAIRFQQSLDFTEGASNR